MGRWIMFPLTKGGKSEAIIWNVLDINFEVLVICSGGIFQQAVGNTEEDS